MSNKFLEKWFPAVPVAVMLISAFSHSCANTTTPPSGGDKDTIPPVIVAVKPESGATNLPREKTKLEFTFNEYVVVKDQKSIFLSPPLQKAPKYKIKGKSVIVYFEDEKLDSARTYVLDLTGAIADNNEGNKFPGYTLVFSTGDRIDSMMVSGTVLDCNTLLPIKGATVMMYKDQADSAIFLKRPDAAGKTDDWGYFCIRNIQDTIYRVYAIVDENSNNKYESESEKVAFLDTLFRPTKYVADSIPELAKYDMKDTASCLARPCELELNIFREKPRNQFIRNKGRVGERTAYITFMAPNAQIDSIWIKGIAPEKLITQFNILKDSLEIWVNEPKKLADTLYLNVDYKKTDSLGFLVKTHELIKLPRPKGSKAKKSSKDIKKTDTTCVVKIEAKPEFVEQYGFVFEFEYPIVQDAFDSLSLKWVNPKQQEGKSRYTVIQDTLNLRKYTVKPLDKLLPGYDYILKVPHRKFKDINGFYNDSTEVKVSLPNDDKASTMKLNIKNVHEKYIVDMLNEKKNTVLRSYIIDSDTDLLFPYLQKGSYCIRITEDLNRNGIVDTGSLLDHRQPERVKYVKLNGTNEYIQILEMTEMEQEIDLGVLFGGDAAYPLEDLMESVE